MDDRRQVHRRTPITTVFDNGQEFVAKPLPWMVRNDLGEEIIRQNTEAVNEAVSLMMDESTNLPVLEMKLAEKLSQPLEVLKIAYPENQAGDFGELAYDEMISLLLAAVEVNHLEHIKHLVDPNSPPPMPSGGLTSLAEGVTEAGPKIESLPDSSSSASTEITSSP